MNKTKFNTCIFFNVEVDTNNINSKDEKLGAIERVYEQEALRLIKSIQLIKELKDIPIYTILFKPLTEYKRETLEILIRTTNVLTPVLSTKHKNDISNFYSGFWYIPLTGLLMENTFNKTLGDSYLVDINGDIPILEPYALKLDNDMIMLRNPFNTKEFKESLLTNKLVCGYYDKDKGSDTQARIKYGFKYMSNTCLIFSHLNKNVYRNWFECLINEKVIVDDLFEEVSFDITFPFNDTTKTTIAFTNFQIGENYLCPKDLTQDEFQQIYFYHQRLEASEKDIYKVIPELKMMVRVKD